MALQVLSISRAGKNGSYLCWQFTTETAKGNPYPSFLEICFLCSGQRTYPKENCSTKPTENSLNQYMDIQLQTWSLTIFPASVSFFFLSVINRSRLTDKKRVAFFKKKKTQFGNSIPIFARKTGYFAWGVVNYCLVVSGNDR